MNSLYRANRTRGSCFQRTPPSPLHTSYRVLSVTVCVVLAVVILRRRCVAALASLCGVACVWPCQLAPVVSTGIEVMETDSFTLHCFQTPTGMCELGCFCSDPHLFRIFCLG